MKEFLIKNIRKYIFYLLLLLLAEIYACYEIFSTSAEIHFLDITQGDSIFIKSAYNSQILIDGGPGNFVLEELSEIMPFFDKSIDVLILTHPDYDHLNGLIEVVNRFDVGLIMFTAAYSNSAYYEEFLRLIEKKNIDFIIIDSEKDFIIDGMRFDVLFPFEVEQSHMLEDINASSVVINLDFYGIKVLLTGDAGINEEANMIDKKADLKADIIKIGHHGSKNSSSLNFLQAVKAKIAVIQCSIDNSYGHPHQEVISNIYKSGISKIYRTDLDSRVSFIFHLN